MKGKRNPRASGKPRGKRSRKAESKDKAYEYARDVDSRDAKNDVSWYNRNPNLLLAAGSFPYPNRPGMTLQLGNRKSVGTGDNFTKLIYPIPGAMVLNWVPNIGRSSQATDPASVLGKEMYARVRQVYSGSLDVDAPDYVMYVMALDSAFAYIAWLKRVFRCINAWSPENYFTPDGVLTAFGFSYAEIANLRKDKTNLWQCINDLVLQSHKFTVPASMDVFNRHYWMSDNVYTDASSINSQFYIFNPLALYKYGEVNMPSGDPASGLKMTLMPTAVTRSEPLTVQALYQFGLDLINALVAWDDAYTINGYLRRAFEGEPQFVIGEIGPTEVLTPVYEPEVLMQIENSRCIPRGDTITDWSTFNVSQDVMTNAVISDPHYTVTIASDLTGAVKYGMYQMEPTLSIRSDTPTVADSVVASRLQAAVEATDKGSTIEFHVDAGTEIPVMWKTSLTDTATGRYAYGIYHQLQCVTIDVAKNGSEAVAAMRNVMNMLLPTAFDWSPFSFVVFCTINGGAFAGTFDSRICMDVHNITSISKESLANLHKICIYSEFNSFGLI